MSSDIWNSCKPGQKVCFLSEDIRNQTLNLNRHCGYIDFCGRVRDNIGRLHEFVCEMYIVPEEVGDWEESDWEEDGILWEEPAPFAVLILLNAKGEEVQIQSPLREDTEDSKALFLFAQYTRRAHMSATNDKTIKCRWSWQEVWYPRPKT